MRRGTQLAFVCATMKEAYHSSIGRVQEIATQLARGIVERVDLINREVDVRLPGNTVSFDVPTDCPVLLHGERIRFRLIQKGDRVAVTYQQQATALKVCRLEVQPDLP